jgi:hypothetical protein
MLVRLVRMCTAVLTLVVLGESIVGSIGSPVHAAEAQTSLPSILLDDTAHPIPVGRTDPFFVYLSYGDPALSYEVSNVQLRVTLSQPGIVFDDTRLFDLHNTDDNTLVTPCNDKYTGPSQKISSSMVTKEVLEYGPGSANQGKNPSGTISSSLSTKQVGCLKIGLKLSEGAAEGTIVEIQSMITSSNGKKIGFYKASDTPPPKTVRLAIGTAPTCAAGQDIFNLKCVASCTTEQYRDSQGVCRTARTTCQKDQELVGGSCQKKCADDESRSAFGECKRGEQPQNALVEKIAEYSIIGLICLGALWLIQSIFKKLRKRSPR